VAESLLEWLYNEGKKQCLCRTVDTLTLLHGRAAEYQSGGGQREFMYYALMRIKVSPHYCMYYSIACMELTNDYVLEFYSPLFHVSKLQPLPIHVGGVNSTTFEPVLLGQGIWRSFDKDGARARLNQRGM
jgi:hypothetical protein